MKKCPDGVVDGETLVTKSDPDDKSFMVCMDSSDYADYTLADEAGYTDFSTMTPAVAYKYGVCNYKYRTDQLANRCYFKDKRAAVAFDFHVPEDFVVVFAQVPQRLYKAVHRGPHAPHVIADSSLPPLFSQSFFSSAFMSVAFAVVGTIGITTLFLWSMESPQWLTDFCIRRSGGHQAYKVIWVAIWAASAAMMILGSRMFFDSVK